MKSYKDFDKKFIGSSDIASLTLRSGRKVAMLDFVEDGDYNAYIVTEDAMIGKHYNLVFEGSTWLTIYDDNELTFQARADAIKIYRAGEFGCIIQLLGNVKIEKVTNLSQLYNEILNLTQKLNENKE